MFVNSLVPYGTRATTMWVIPLFGQAVNKKALHVMDAYGRGGVLNPADSLMIPLCLEWELQASVNVLAAVFYLSYQN